MHAHPLSKIETTCTENRNRRNSLHCNHLQKRIQLAVASRRDFCRNRNLLRRFNCMCAGGAGVEFATPTAPYYIFGSSAGFLHFASRFWIVRTVASQ